MTAPVSWLINDLDKAIKTKSTHVWLVIVMDCQSGYSYHQQDKQVLGGCLRNPEGQAAVQAESVRLFRRFGGGRYR